MFRFNKIVKFIVAGLAALTLQACAGGPRFDEVAAVHEPPAPGLGRIYVYRTSALGAAIQPAVKLNGETVGEAVPLGFFFVDRPSGDYTVSASTEVERTLSMTLDAGQTRYVRLGVSMGFFVGHVSPELVDNGEGERDIEALHYTGIASAPTRYASAPVVQVSQPVALAPLPPEPPPAVAVAAPIALEALPSPPPAPAPVAASLFPPVPGPEPVTVGAVSHAAIAVDPALRQARVPFLSDAQQSKFQEYLSKPTPRAFVISDNGHFASVWGLSTDRSGRSPDPSARALEGCRSVAGKSCVLYAVDNAIVYQDGAAGR